MKRLQCSFCETIIEPVHEGTYKKFKRKDYHLTCYEVLKYRFK